MPDNVFQAPNVSTVPAGPRPRAPGRTVWFQAVGFLVYQFPAGVIGNLPFDLMHGALSAWLVALAVGAFTWARGYRLRGLAHPADLRAALRLVLAFHMVTKGLPILGAALAPHDDVRIPLLVLAEWFVASAAGLLTGLAHAAPAPPDPPPEPDDEDDDIDVFAEPNGEGE